MYTRWEVGWIWRGQVFFAAFSVNHWCQTNRISIEQNLYLGKKEKVCFWRQQEGSIMQILQPQRHWRRSNEMLQGQLLDNSFTQGKAKVLWDGSQHVTFLSLLRDISPLLLLTIISWLDHRPKSRIVTAPFSEHLSNLTATKYWQFWKWGFSFSTNHLLKSWNILVDIVTFWDPYPSPPLIES